MSSLRSSTRKATCPGCRMQVTLLEETQGPLFQVHKLPKGGFCSEGGKPVPAQLLAAEGTTPAAHFKKEIERYSTENLALFEQCREAENSANQAEGIALRCIQMEHAKERGGVCRSCTPLVTGHLNDTLRSLRQRPKSRKA
jgi:hypothetical protein